MQKAKYVQVLQEEIQERTQINWDTVSRNTADPLIILALANETIVSTYSLPSPQNKDFNLKPEGFRIQITHEKNRKVIWLIGNDTRGVLFAIGSFLSNIKWSKQKVEISPDFVLQTSPAYPLRGHQLGYRNTANSWDAWTVKQMEKYIRELALMGTNAIENIPLDTDGPVNPHFKISSEEMNLKMSEICRDYGIEYWVWTPGKVDLSNPAFFQKEVDRHAVLYKQCPKLDSVRLCYRTTWRRFA